MLPDIKKILFATDLSEDAEYAFGYAAFMANKFDAKITVLHVFEEMTATGRSLLVDYLGQDRWEEIMARKGESFQEAVRVRLEDFCKEMKNVYKECPFIVEKTVVRDGRAPEEILYETEAGVYDLLVMGSHGRGFMADALMGNTARRVVRRCKIPVTVLRLPEEKRSETE
jgi:nucleotide-binding universal stress UspA family protein